MRNTRELEIEVQLFLTDWVSLMHVLFLISSMSAGGAERVASTLVNAWVLRGDKVILMPTFSGRGECFYELSSDVRLVYLADLVSSRATTLVNQLERLRVLRRFIARERPDVIVSFLYNVNLAAVVASAGLNIPIVICERTDPFACPPPFLARIACRFLYPFADAVMVQTQAVAARYRTSNRALRQVWIIPNPVPEQFLSRAAPPSVTEKKHLLAIGRLSSEKQFDLLIRVFARLASRHSDWVLRILGEGPLRADLETRISQLGLKARVELPGRTADIGGELRRADAFVLTSEFEGFPNALLEAMVAGLPAVTFDCPSGPREISMDGQAALLVVRNDEPALEFALERLMLDDNLRQTLGRRARESVIARFALSTVLEKWDMLFESVGVSH